MSLPVNVESRSTPVPFAHESITVSNAVKSLTEATYAPATQGQVAANVAWITVADDNIRYWLDGSSPTATVGHVLADGDGLEIGGQAIRLFRCIRETTDAIISVSYFSQPCKP